MKNTLLLGLIFLPTQLFSMQTVKHETGDWHSWAGVQCSPSRIYYPETIVEVQNIIKEALKNRIPVRFVGSGHSINNLVCTSGYIVNTDAFNRVLSIDTKNCTVRVEGGMKLKHLFKELARHGLALLNQGFIKEQSIAGALATGTHGTGKTGTLSDFVIGMDLIDGRGNYHKISADSNPGWLDAARLNLGALGFVYAVTLQCVPLFVLRHKRKMKDWTEVFEHFQEYYHDNDYFMIMAHPVSDKALVYTWNVTYEKPTNNFFIRLSERLLTNEITNYLTIKAAYWIPGVTNDFIEHFFKAMEQKEHREYSYRTLSPIKRPFQVEDYIEEEIAIPINYFKQAVQDIFALYRKYEKDDFELVGFMTCRFVKGSRKALLSPAYDQDCAYISLITLSCFKKYREFYQEFERIMRKYTYARSHWGKFNSMSRSYVAQVWGENVEQFNRVRSILDPYKLFTNEYLFERIG